MKASSAKAGLSTDQDEINRKIYEASKGSKFFQNEKLRDEKTTQQIEKMLRKRDEALANVAEGCDAWRTLEQKIEERAVQLEATRDFSRIILHADMDMFYAAVELKRDPSLLGKAFGVGSGVLVTASYEARKFGVRSGMAQHIAVALCPHLIIVKNDMASYVEASRSVMEIMEDYDPTLAQMSLDEAYLDVTPYCDMNDLTVDEVVAQLRDEVKEKTGLTVSVGIAPNKMLAKISSDKNKPNGQFRVPPDRNYIIDFMRNLPCRKIPGIGRVTERILSSLGIETCGDIWTHRVILSLTLSGSEGIDWLLCAHLGLASNVVEPGKRGERRSVGREHTFRPTSDVTTLLEMLRASADQVAKDLDRLDYRAKTITLTCKTDTYRRFTRAKTMLNYTWKADDLYAITARLLETELDARHGKPLSLRLIGVRTSSLKDLREPEKGGIKRMFEQSSESSSSKKVRGQGEPDWEDEDETLQRALKASRDDYLASTMEADVGAEGKDVETEILKQAEKGERDVEKEQQKLEEGKLKGEVSEQDDRTSDGAGRSRLESGGAERHHDDPLSKPSAVRCPICSQAIPMRKNENDDVINQRLNQHIDLCLSSQQNAEARAKPKEEKAKREKKVGTLDRFVQRA